MKSIILFFCCFLALVNGLLKVVTFEAKGRNDSIEKCWSEGEEYRPVFDDLGRLENDEKYSDINNRTRVIAHGCIYGCITTKYLSVDHLLLSKYTDTGRDKQFFVRWGWEEAALFNWVIQMTYVELTVIFYPDGYARLGTSAYAASWKAVECAKSKYNIQKIEAMIDIQEPKYHPTEVDAYE